MELSIVIPCLNESETIAICIKKAKTEIVKLNLNAEIIVSDNGSTDGSVEIAKKLNATVISCKEKGYGSAVINGIINSKGKYILIADADDSYNFEDLPLFYKKIKEGYDLVQGCRMPSGGGKIVKGAMPITHRLIGNPIFSMMGKIFFSLSFNDVYCGMKIIRRDFFKKENLLSRGMVFCIEILIRSKVLNARVCELPITFFKDGRKYSKSHLKTVSDGLKTLKFFLICCPKWLYFIPSLLFLLFIPVSLFYKRIFNELQETELILSQFLIFFLSFQFFMFGLFSSLRARDLGLYKGLWLDKFFKIFNLKIAFLLSGILVIASLSLYVFDIDILTKDKSFIAIIFLLFFSINLIANSLVISLLSLNK
jgi:glycosyltransferase involved in cell wall biosynthesis